MQAQVISDFPGRIRLRYGQYVFTEPQAYAFEALLRKKPYVKHALAKSVNGSLFIEYREDAREALIDFLSRINPMTLEGIEAPAGDRRDLARRFKQRIMRQVVMKFTVSRLLPLSVYKLWVLYRAYPFIKEGIDTLKKKEINVSLLDAVSIGLSILTGSIGTASDIMFFLTLSEELEAYTTQRVQMDLIRSLQIHVDTVWKKNAETDEMERVPFSTIQKSDLIMVNTGQVIPVDGVVREGEGFVDEASMTGESAPVEKRTGSRCYAGTVLADGGILLEVLEIGDKTKRHQIIEEINAAGKGKSERVTRAELFANKLVPYHFVGATALYLLTGNFTTAMAVLLVDYSCAIRLCTPIAILAAIREAADHSIAIKGGRYLEEFATAKNFLFDKTGTLTKAQPELVKVISFTDLSEDELLRQAACIEEHFPHSVAKAIVRAAEEKNLHHKELHGEVEYVVAHGIRSTLYGKDVLVGSHHFLFEDEKIPLKKEAEEKLRPYHGKYSILYMSYDGELSAAFLIDDPPRTEAPLALALLRKDGVKNMWMVTGDGEAMATRIGQQLGMDQIYAQVLPEEKTEIVRNVQREYGPVVMIGDGINDSPSLAQAEISVSMKEASDIAREVADIVLLDSDLRKLMELRELSKSMNKRIERNLRKIILYNSVFLIAGITGMLMPAQTALFHNASTFILTTESAKPYHCLKEKEA